MLAESPCLSVQGLCAGWKTGGSTKQGVPLPGRRLSSQGGGEKDSQTGNEEGGPDGMLGPGGGRDSDRDCC